MDSEMNGSSLQELVLAGSASLGEIATSLDVSLTDLSNRELVEVGSHLLTYGQVLDDVTQHSGFYRKVFDQHTYYFGVKGDVTPRMADFHVQRLMKLKGKLVRAAGDPLRAREVYIAEASVISGLEEVRTQFEGIDIHAEEYFESVLDAMTAAFACPEIVPDAAIAAFNGRWYTTKQFHGDYGYGLKDVAALREDGRKPMFLEGVSLLQSYLQR